jgi:menaquinone-9 beta-reductase
MSRTQYDVITVGGGLGGATLGKALAERGLRALVLERETQFKDRVRGEQIQPWGVADAKALGIHDLLNANGAHEQPWVDLYLGPMQMAHRDLSATTPQGAGHLNIFHPAMQEALLGAASVAGAEVRRGVTVRAVCPGRPPSVIVESASGATEELSARLVVGADGRNSFTRKTAGFAVQQDPPFLMIAGVLFDEMRGPEDTGFIFLNPQTSQSAFLFPQGEGRVRAYVAYPVAAGYRLQGEKDVSRFIQESRSAGGHAHLYEGAKAAGPLASFDAADTWVDSPYRDGVALVGDAAASMDPSWGQGLSLTMRDVRVLRDHLLAIDDWDVAVAAYAAEHDRHYRVMHEVTLAMKDLFMRAGPEYDALRARVLPRVGEDPTRLPDHPFAGPDLPWNDDVRARFLGPEMPVVT